ncbi:hypothetical protein VZ95_14750 [Elstera litoralis]|uniref:HPt domain-containing protein n=1 Tax=Elstera litoralis TaxID=552518 RepID=A0A0F3IQM1_9PROT|nr:Hpt domain-containing protein [Elstera litoralis]KJV08907.1 hypothetical protein VZ95_14750 [Elstera litoralis]
MLQSPHPAVLPERLPETLKAAVGLVELLLTTDLTLEQKHYTLALARLLTCDAETRAPAPEGIAYIDREVLAELHHYLPARGCAAILAQFHGTADQLLTDAAEALAAEAPEALARTAHSLIGTMGAVGMTLMVQEARAITLALRQNDWACAAARTAALPALYEASTAALKTVIETFSDKSL